MADHLTTEEWMRYALVRIHHLVDKPRDTMSDDELTVFTFTQNALAGGEPTIRLLSRGPGVRMCRVCLAEWSDARPADHVHGCPNGDR